MGESLIEDIIRAVTLNFFDIYTSFVDVFEKLNKNYCSKSFHIGSKPPNLAFEEAELYSAYIKQLNTSNDCALSKTRTTMSG